MATVQLNFSLRTGPKCKTVHLLGSWNNYAAQYPLAKDSAKPGGWKGTFKFTNGALRQGQRYWYYYIIDGYHVSHDPARDSTTEPTTGRKLNILDIPAAKPSASSYAPPPSSNRHSRHPSSYVPSGRSLSPSQIASPHPSKPYATRDITHMTGREMEALSRAYAAQRLSDVSSISSLSDGSDSEGYSDTSPVPSLRSGSSTSRSGNSSPSSISSSSSCCTCERYAIKRDGTRVKLDCGGKRCGYSDSSECSSESEEDERERYRRAVGGTRRQGIVVRR